MKISTLIRVQAKTWIAMAAAAAWLAAAPAGWAGQLEIPFTKFELENGLTLIVHEDKKAPIVAVNVWYHVGSKNEKPGKTGFAHLFEHLMFNGSENHNDDYFAPFDRVGATGLNGTTNADRTNYFETVPKGALDMALWMESDRMGHLLGVIDQARLDEQRGVVQNEKRQGENQPYGRVFELIGKNTYPKGHPYSWSTIGSMEDLDAASIDDVKEWFRDYYGAANAVISIAGDVDAEEVHEKVVAYFGDIPAGPPFARPKKWIAERSEATRMVTQDRVPQARLIKVWNIPPIGSEDAVYLDLATSVLSAGKTSRLYKRLVYEDQIATDIAGFVWLREIGGSLIVWATAQPGQDLSSVEDALDQEIARFVEKGPTKAELERVKMQAESQFVRGLEVIGGFGGKSDLLARSQVYGGSPDAYLSSRELLANASTKDVKKAAQRWIHGGVFTLEVHPFPDFSTTASSVDRTSIPEASKPEDVAFPPMQRTTLANGLQIIVAERHSIPVVDLRLLFDAGYAADQGNLMGTASLAMNMLDEGTKKRSALEISEELDMLGADLGTGSNLDMSTVSLSALSENLDDSLDVFADVVLNPTFAEADLERLRRQQLASIQREKVTPFKIALRVFPQILYGKSHAYGLPFTGSGTEESVAAIQVETLRKFHSRLFRPNNATLVIVGDTTLAEIQPKIEKLFGNWQAAEVPEKNISEVSLAQESSVYLIDRPGSLQSMVIAGHIAPPKANPDEIAIESVNKVLGGSFTSRLNMNLREDKHWAYGAHSTFIGARGQRPFFAYAQVQTDKTAESAAEMRKEIVEIHSARPPTSDEVDRAKDKLILTLPGRWETQAAVAGSIGEIIRFGYADDHWQTYPDSVRSLDRDQSERAARSVLHPESLLWVIVGDMSKVEAGIRELGLGTVHRIDADAMPVVDSD